MESKGRYLMAALRRRRLPNGQFANRPDVFGVPFRDVFALNRETHSSGCPGFLIPGSALLIVHSGNLDVPVLPSVALPR